MTEDASGIVGDGADRGRIGLARKLGAFGIGVAIFNTVVGSGIFVLPAALAKAVGPDAPLAYLACAVAMGGVVWCFAAAGSRVPTSGGPYGYSRAAFGPFVGFVVGVFVWLGCLLASAGVATAIADNLGRVWPVFATALGRGGLIVVLFGLFGAINTLGVTPGARLVQGLTAAKLIPIAVLLGVGVFFIKPANLAPVPFQPTDFGRAMILALFAFQGMEGALGASGEVKDPARKIPRGLIGAMLVVTVLYVAIQMVTQGVLGPALAQSKAPLADALAGASPLLVALLLAGATISMLGYLSSDTLTAPRILYAFAADGLLPRIIANVHPATRAPYVSVILYVVLGAGLALTGSFVKLVTLASLSSVCAYIIACCAAVVLERRGVQTAGTPLSSAAIYPAAAIGIVGMLWILAQARPEEMLGGLATLVITGLWYGVATVLRRRPEPSTP